MASVLHIDGRLFVGFAGFPSILSEHRGQTSAGQVLPLRLFRPAVDGLYPVVVLADLVGGRLSISKRKKMKTKLNLVLASILIFVFCFAGRVAQPASIYVHRESNSVIPNPQVLIPGIDDIVMFQFGSGFGSQFSWSVNDPGKVLVNVGSYKTMGALVVKTAGTCSGSIIFHNGSGGNTEIGRQTFPAYDGYVVMHFEQFAFGNNASRISYVDMRVTCDQEATIELATLHLVNQ